MKTAKLIIGIISIVLFFVVQLQSCAATVGDALASSESTGGVAGFLVGILMLISGIVSVAARKSKGAGIFCLIMYGLAGIIGMTMKGDYADLGVWSFLCFVFAVFYLISTITFYRQNND